MISVIDVGNLRLRMRDSSIWAPVIGEKEDSSYLFYAPFDKETGIHNKLNNDYDFNFCYDENSTTETGEYIGGAVGCNNVFMDLSKSWNVTFEYVYTGSMESDDIRYSTNTLAIDWNIIFGFGRHVTDTANNVDDLYFSLPVNSFKDTVKTRGQNWCNTTNVQTWHRYAIEYKDNVTLVTIDNVPQETAQFTYPNKVQGFYFSGGGYRHSLACKIKNFSLFGTLAV